MRWLGGLAIIAALGACAPQQPTAVQQIACPEPEPIIIYKFVPPHRKSHTASSTVARIDDAAKASRSLLKNPPNKKGP